VNTIAERDAAQAQWVHIIEERDEAINLVEAREAARIWTVFAAARQATDFDRREHELLCQIEELQINVHRLNNRIDPILPPTPVEEEGPNVLIVEDDGIEVDLEA
jgi:hypothetical protein